MHLWGGWLVTCRGLSRTSHGHPATVLMSLQHEKYTSQLQMNFKGTAMKRAEQPMEHGVYTESQQAKLEKGERKPITGTCSETSCSRSSRVKALLDPCTGSEWSAPWVMHKERVIFLNLWAFQILSFWRLSLPGKKKKRNWHDGLCMPCHCANAREPVGWAGLVSSLAPVWSIFIFLIMSWCLNRDGDSPWKMHGCCGVVLAARQSGTKGFVPKCHVWS